LIVRFPRLFWRRPVDVPWPGLDWAVVRPGDAQKLAEEYPALAADLAVWDGELESRFRKLDHQAQVMQNQFWRQNITLIAGGLVATTLGAVQSAEGGGLVGVAIAQAILTGLLVGLTVLIRARRAQQAYLTCRLRAERIKSEFFLFLARAGGYSGGDPKARLLQRVGDIETAETTS
jgi:hypothetical protein